MGLAMARSQIPNALWICLLALLLVASGCTKSRFASPFLSIVNKSVAEPLGPGTVIATASCVAPAIRIGGGFYVGSSGNDGLVVRGSHPDDANGWTVEVDNTAPSRPPTDSSGILAIAYCLQRADLKPTVTVQTNAVNVTLGFQGAKQIIHAFCPAGSVVTGGGFEVDGTLTPTDASYNAGVEGSVPDSKGWHVDAGQFIAPTGVRTYHAYAVCTSPPLHAGATVTINGPTTPGTLQLVDASCQVSPIAFTTAGGFLLDPSAESLTAPANKYLQRAYESAATGEFLTWTVQGSNLADPPSPIQSLALCTPGL